MSLKITFAKPWKPSYNIRIGRPYFCRKIFLPENFTNFKATPVTQSQFAKSGLCYSLCAFSWVRV